MLLALFVPAQYAIATARLYVHGPRVGNEFRYLADLFPLAVLTVALTVLRRSAAAAAPRWRTGAAGAGAQEAGADVAREHESQADRAAGDKSDTNEADTNEADTNEAAVTARARRLPPVRRSHWSPRWPRWPCCGRYS